ncbi:MAG: hypothetical protein GC192_20055 [Bacteroidetes bacterium]|nr:hypothetical protein [Bacteroidota bacterium]
MKKQLLNTCLLSMCAALALAQKPELGIPVGHSDRINSVDFSPDGQFAVSGSSDKTIRLWDVGSGRLLKLWEPYQLEVGSADISAVGFGNDGKYIVEGAKVFRNPFQMLEIGSTDTGSVRVIKDPNWKLEDLQPFIRALCLTADGDQALTLTNERTADGSTKTWLLKIWNIKNGKLLKTLPDQTDEITALCLSPDGRWAYAGAITGAVQRWDIRKEKVDLLYKNVHNGYVKSLDISPDGTLLLSASDGGSLKLFRADDPSASPIASFPDAWVLGNGQGAVFSKDGTKIAYANRDKAVVVWDIATQTQIAKLEGHAEEISALRFSPDGTKLISGDSGKSLIIWDLASQKPSHILSGNSYRLKQAFFSKNKERLVTVSEFNKTIVSWNALKGTVDRVFAGHKGDVVACCLSPNGRYLISSGEDKQVILWDFESGEILKSLQTKNDIVTSLAISPDNKFALTGTYERMVVLWDLEEEKPLKSFTGHNGKVTSVAFSPDGKMAMSAADDNTVAVYDVTLRKLVSTIPGQANRWSPVAFSPDGKTFLSIAFEASKVEWWDIASKTIIRTFSLSNGPDARFPDLIYRTSLATAVFSPNGDRFLLSSGNDVLLWNLKEDKPKFLHGHQSLVRSVSFSPDGKMAMSAGNDGNIRFWDGLSGKPLCTVLSLGGAEWAAITPEGLFDGSPKALASMYYVVGTETIELEQMKGRYYEPDMLPILLGLRLGTLREVPPLGDMELFPELAADLKKGKLVIDLKKRGRGGVGLVSVSVNGTEVLSDACGGASGCKIELTEFQKHFFTTNKEQNTISVQVTNEGGWLKSPPKLLHPFLKSKGDGAGEVGDEMVFGEPNPPSFYAIVVGTSNYAGSSLTLRFPDLDAHAIGKTLETIAAGTELFNDRVTVKQLTTDATDASSLPSKANIRAAFKQMEATNAEDVLFLYFSGHGATYTDGNKEDFYYLTKDVSDMQLNDDVSLRNSVCISTDTLNAWLSEIPAKKRVIIFDACHSGKAAEALKGSKAPQASQKRELQRLQDRSGTFVLAGCEANQLSYEDPDLLQQGLLTYGLLYGLQSRKGTLTDGAVDVQTLFQFARDEVPNLASDLNLYQKPVLTVPSGDASSFSIGWVHPGTNIQLERKNQFVIQSMFLNKEGFNDDLGLSVAFDDRLTEGGIEGNLGKMVFANTRQLHEACAIRGLYTVADGKITRLDGRIFLPNNVTKEFVVQNVPSTDVTGLVDKIVSEVNSKLVD